MFNIRFHALVSYSVTICVALMFSMMLEAAPRTFNLGVVNERPDRPDHVISQYSLLHEYLRAKLQPEGIEVGKLVIMSSISELIDKLRAGEVDGFFEGVMPSIEVQSKVAIQPGLLVWRKGQRDYHTVFFVRRDSDIQTLDGLAGKTIIFESPRSTSAYRVPRITLESMGYDLVPAGQAADAELQFLKYRFSGTEENQAYWIERKLGDLGAFNNGDWERVPEVVRQELTIIGRSKPVLRWLFNFRSSVEADIQTQVSQVLLKMHEDQGGQAALEQAENISKFETLTPEDMDNYRYWQASGF